MLSIEQITPFLTWQLRHEVLYPNQNKQDMGMEEDNLGYHFAAFKDNYIVGVISLFQTGTDWQFRKLAVSDKMQKAGIGTQLLNYITGFVLQEHGTCLWCNARLSATGFYEKLGFTQTEDIFHKKGVDYIIMRKDLAVK